MKSDHSRTTFVRTRHATSVLKQQGRVDLDADWNEQLDIAAHLRGTALVDTIGPVGAPVTGGNFEITAAGADVRIAAGRYYVDGVLVENEQDVSVFDQPDLPDAGPFVRRLDGNWVPDGTTPPAGLYTAWLHVWPQLRTAVEDPAIREVALGGPDTTTRVVTAWNVRLLQAGLPGASVDCADDPPGWGALTTPSTGTLAAWAEPLATPPQDCVIPISSPYRGLDNRLYRVEIHDGGAPGTATYVWSRDNGSVVASWTGRSGSVLTLTRPGRDGSAGFVSGSWAELIDDGREQLGLPGTLVQVDHAEGDQLTILPATATGSLDLADFPDRPRVRRWEGRGTVPTDDSEIHLELGVRVRFGGAATLRHRTGDWWSFAARAATHDVEWPEDGTTPRLVTSHGPDRHEAKLAVLGFDGTAWTLVRDCRPGFAPLTGQLTLDYLGGDGQEALPDVTDPTALVALAQDLVVGVSTGGSPVSSARVRFDVIDGNGRLDGTGPSVTVQTAADGTARAAWEVDSGTAVQRVRATLLDDSDTAVHLPIELTATLSVATGVAYDPAQCPDLAGTATVQEAIDRLCTVTGDGCATLTLSPGSGWVEALEGLAAGSDANVCLRPGLYESDRRVEIRDLGHVRIAGSGLGSRVVVTGSESALLFERCASVAVSGLDLAVTRYPQTAVKGSHGVVSAIDCGRVTVDGVRLSCPAATASRATCLTVRTGGSQRSTVATDAVHVRDCDFRVGHAQTGLLIVNADEAAVEGCTFTTPAKPATLGLGVLLADPTRLGLVTDLLVADLAIDRAGSIVRGAHNTALTVGDWAVRVNSTVPEGEWRSLVAENPPTTAELATADAVGRYVDRIVAGATEDPSVLPTYDRQLRALRDRLGANAGAVFETAAGRQTTRTLLLAGAADVQPLAEVSRIRRAVSLPTAGATLRFDSALDQSSWEAALAAMPLAAGATPVMAARHLRAVAERMVTESTFGDRFAALFRRRLESRNPAASACAIRVGGQVVGALRVEDNEIRGTAEGVHVGTSFERGENGPIDKATSVRVIGNDVRLVVPVERDAAPRGIFVGNNERAVVADNQVSVTGGQSLHGIEIDGVLGPHLAVRDNAVDRCRVGVTLRRRGDLPQTRLWVIADNLAAGASPAVAAPPQARVTGNVS